MQTLPKKMRLLALMTVLAVALAACVVPAVETEGSSDAAGAAAPAASEAEEVVITHPQGETTVVKNPETVVVFDYSALDTLDTLGVPVAGVPQGSAIPPFLEQYTGEEYVNVGTLFEPDYEAVNALEPDLIIIGGRSSGVYEEISKIAPTIDVTVDQADFVNSASAVWTNLGIIFDKEDEVAEVIADVEASIARVSETAAASADEALIVMTTGGNVNAYGPGSRFGIIHDLLGVKPVVEDVEVATHGDAISFEFILEHNPDILFVVDRDSAIGEDSESAQQILDNELVHETSAWQNENLVYLTPTYWYLANSGLSTVPAMIAEVEAGLE